jgi:hypothetical protein
MTIFDRVKKELYDNKKIRESGEYTCIPFKLLPDLGKVVPGVQREKYSICTAGSKVGKSKLAQFLFIYNPYHFVTKFETNISLKIIYNSLEVSKEEILCQYLSYRLFVDHKLIIAPDKLRSNFEDYVLEDNVLKLIECYDEEMQRFESMVHIQDTVKNPFGLYSAARSYAYQNGQHFDKSGTKIPVEDLISPNETIRNKALFSIDSYVPNNPNEYVIIITDHISLLTPEKGSDLWNTIGHFSNHYCMSMRDRWKYHVVNVQQQAADQDKQQFTFRGDSIVAKLRPSPDGLADNKTTQRDVNLMFGLFAPHRYKIENYEGYDIDKLGDNYREFSVILNRSGTGFINMDLFFHGACNYFHKLPNVDKMRPEDYKKIIDLNKTVR